MIALITGIIGLASTLCAWYLNPKRQLYATIDSIYKQLEDLYVKRDKALSENDSIALTLVNANILRLCQTKNNILQRLG